MPTVKKIFVLFVAFFMIVALMESPALAITKLKIGHAAQPSHPFQPACDSFAEVVKAKTGGEVEITVYPSRQLGDDKALMEGIQLGTIDMALISTGIFDVITPTLNALQLPWLIKDYDMALKVYGSPALYDLLSNLEKLGIKGLGVYEGGERQFVSRKRPINTIEDFQGQKTRVVPAALHLSIWKALGTNPTPMAYGEVYMSLQTGVLDAAEANLTSIYSEKYYEVTKYVTLDGHYMWPGMICMNLNRFNSLSENAQQAMIEAAKEILPGQIEATRKLDERAINYIKEKGLPINKVTAENLEPMIKATEPVYKEYMDKDPAIAKFVKAVRAMK